MSKVDGTENPAEVHSIGTRYDSMSFDGVKTVFKKIIFVLAVLMISASVGNAAPDSKGTDFWLAFPTNGVTGQLTLFIAGDTATTGTVTGPGMAPTNFSVAPGTVTVVNIPIIAELNTSDTVESKGIHVTAQAEVTVYGLNRAVFSSDAYLGLPTDILGTDYIVLGYSGSGPELAIVGTVDGTIATITLSASVGSRAAGVPFNINLNQGQTYQLRGSADLSGTIITSDKPIAVFGGNSCTNIPPGFAFCDHIVEQLPPTQTWGKSFVTVPLATRNNGDTFRFLASTNGTNITVNGTVVTPVPLNRGQFHERIINGSAVITSDQPILVAQYSNGCAFDSACGSADGDPFMMLIPPFEQFLGQYTVSTPDDANDTTPQFPANFINVVAPNAAVGAITLDGTAIPTANFTAIGSSGFSGAQVSLSQGSHNLSGPLPFGAFIYGFGSFDSYGYPGGLSLAPIARVTSVALTPATATNPIGTQQCFTATVTDQNNQPVVGVRVDFNVTGTNQTAGFINTDSAGQAQFCYTGTNAGQDTIDAAVGQISDSAIMTWTGGQANTPPVADPQLVSTPEDTPKVITLTGTDADDDPLTFIIVTPPAHGTLSGPTAATKAQRARARRQLKARLLKERKLRPKALAAILQSISANTVTYTPDLNYNGPDSFTFRVNDGTVNSAPATVNITVTPTEDNPEIQNLTFARRDYSTPGIAALLEFRDIDGDFDRLNVTLLKARNLPKGCGPDVIPSDEASIFPFSETRTDPDSDPTDFEATEIKAVEIGPDAMAVAAAHGCNITLEITAFNIRGVDLAQNGSNVLSGTFSIDSDGGTTTAAPLSNRLRSSSKAPKKITAPVFR